MKVNFNKDVVALKQIILPTHTIEIGEVFKLKDAYKEGNGIFIGVETPHGVQEAGFKINPKARIKNKAQVKSFVAKIVLPYIEGASYTFIT